jgi:hypothetical protein
MEDQFSNQVNSSKEPPQQTIPLPAQITPENLERMKQQARELAVAQYYAQQQGENQPQAVGYRVERSMQVSSPPPRQEQQVVYVRRNLTIAELLVIFAVSCGLVYGIPTAWNFVSQNIPRIEIRVK